MKTSAFFAIAAGFAVAGCTPNAEDGKAIYMEYCAGCHGATGQGNGPMADDLNRAPSDLTQLAANNDGVFPRVEVMSAIDGYSRTDQGENPMPEFGGEMHSRLLLVDTGDGVMTPTPERLAALTDYLESIQQ